MYLTSKVVLSMLASGLLGVVRVVDNLSEEGSKLLRKKINIHVSFENRWTLSIQASSNALPGAFNWGGNYSIQESNIDAIDVFTEIECALWADYVGEYPPPKDCQEWPPPSREDACSITIPWSIMDKYGNGCDLVIPYLKSERLLDLIWDVARLPLPEKTPTIRNIHEIWGDI